MNRGSLRELGFIHSLQTALKIDEGRRRAACEFAASKPIITRRRGAGDLPAFEANRRSERLPSSIFTVDSYSFPLEYCRIFSLDSFKRRNASSSTT